MKKVLIIFALVVSILVMFSSCKGSKTCPAYSKNDIENSESVNS